MFKRKVTGAVLVCAASFMSVSVFAASKAEQELVDYLSSIGVQDRVTWERVEGDSLADATIYGITYLSDKGSEDKKYLIKKMTFDNYEVGNDGVSVSVKYQGITDEEGVHFLLSEKLQSERHLSELGYEQLDDMEVNLNYVMQKLTGALEGGFKVKQDEVAAMSLDFKAEGVDSLIAQLINLDIATLDPNLILLSAMTAEIHELDILADDDGYNQRRINFMPDHVKQVEGKHQECLQNLNELNLNALESACVAIRDYQLDREGKLRVSINPAKPFAIGSYVPMFMLLGSAGPDASEKLVQQILNEINLKVSN